ncbi:MAG TPA: hypothetical protein DIS94_01500 [Bacteroidetes bacterium]|nr:hypothetical protein [Bacteroidota bacterium]
MNNDKLNIDENKNENEKMNENYDETLKVGEDYYYENGFIVFTEDYHLKRGYCCKSGCRHCPYNYRII